MLLQLWLDTFICSIRIFTMKIQKQIFLYCLIPLFTIISLNSCSDDEPIVVIPPDVRKTFIPDDNFEKALIEFGYDDVVDDSVLTSKIERVLSLKIDSRNINDLTGLEKFTNLNYFDCSNNNIEILDVSKITYLLILRCTNNRIEKLDLSQNILLKGLTCWVNRITELDLSNNPLMGGLYAQSNNISKLNISQCKELWTLVLTDNNLTDIDLTNTDNLDRVFIGNNALKHIDISTNPKINILHCDGNKLTELNISKNPKIEILYCYGNKLTELNVSNGNNLLLFTFDATNNPSLRCIQVDDEEKANSGVHNPYKNWKFDRDVILSEDCIY